MGPNMNIGRKYLQSTCLIKNIPKLYKELLLLNVGGSDHLTLAQVMISWFVSLSPSSGFALTVWSLPGILSLSHSLCPPPLSLSLFVSFNKLKIF